MTRRLSAAIELAGGHRIRARGAGEAVDSGDEVGGRQIEHAFAGANHVLGGPGVAREPEHAAPSHPPDRGHRREILGAVVIGRSDQDDGCSEIQNGRVDLDGGGLPIAFDENGGANREVQSKDLSAALQNGKGDWFNNVLAYLQTLR